MIRFIVMLNKIYFAIIKLALKFFKYHDALNVLRTSQRSGAGFTYISQMFHLRFHFMIQELSAKYM